MDRLLRGARSRAGVLLMLVAVTTAVVAGTVTVFGFAHRAGTSGWLVLPLFALGLLAVPAAGAELASARREEIGVARLRGLEGARLIRLLLVEPGLAIALGTVLGVALGWLGSVLAVRRWLGATLGWPGWSAAIAVLAVALVGIAAVLVGMRGALREPLADQVALAERPRRASVAALFGTLFVLVAAVVAVYRARTSSGDPGWLVWAGPAVVGLAAGQLAVWATAAVTRLAVSRSRRAGPGLYLAVRRLRGTAGLTSSVRLLVAAMALAVLALTGASAAYGWADTTAQMRTVGGLRVAVEDGGALEAFRLSHQLDPEGRWLMAGSVILDEHAGGRRAFLDTERFERVVGDTMGADLADQVAALVPAGDAGLLAERAGLGDRLTLTLAGPPSAQPHVRVDVDYVGAGGVTGTATVRWRPTDGGSPTASAEAPGCRQGCVATAVEISARPRIGVVLLSELWLGNTDLLAATWQLPAWVDIGPSGMAVTTERPTRLAPPAVAEPVPVLATRRLASGTRLDQVVSPGALPADAAVRGRAPALPFVEGDGLVADLPTMLVGDRPTVPAAQSFVVARTDTPAAILAGLAAAGAGRPETLADVRREVTVEAGATQASAYALVAGFGLAVAALVTVAAGARQRERRRHEIAALRLLGLTCATQRRSGWMEQALLAAAAVVGGLVGGLVAVQLLLTHLPFIHPAAESAPLDLHTPTWVLVGVAGVAVAALLAAGTRARTFPASQTRPAILREELGG